MRMSTARKRAPAKKLAIPTHWTFKNPRVAADFDRHVREQLPWYDLATGVVAHVARHYVPQGGTVVDVGASTGNVGRAITETLRARNARLVAVDNSADMLKQYAGPGSFVVCDVRNFNFAAEQPDLIVAFLALMFVPVADRGKLIRDMKDAVRPGGAVFVVDKTHARPGHVGTVIYRLTLAAKYEAGGAPADEIIRKELSIAGIQRPMHESELAGFEPVFRFGDFAGFLFEKPASV